MKKYALTLAGLSLMAAGALLTGCDTSVTAGICSDASALQASGVALNAAETTGLTGIVTSCASTAGGTVFNNLSVANAIIADAIILQKSGLLADVHITAQVPADQKVLKKIKLDARAWLKGA